MVLVVLALTLVLVLVVRRCTSAIPAPSGANKKSLPHAHAAFSRVGIQSYQVAI